MFTSAQKQGILAEARANLAKHDRTSGPQLDLVYKTKDDARAPADGAPSERGVSVASGSELSWWEWTERCVDARLEAAAEEMGKVLGEFHNEALREVAAIKRELELLRRELATVRDEVAVERGLKDLRDQIETTKNQVPKLPAIVERLEAQQARFKRELETTRKRVGRTRVDQSIADFKLNELRKATAARSASLEMKIETSISSFEIGEIHPSAQRALHDFAAEALKGTRRDEKIWVFDPAPAAGTA